MSETITITLLLSLVNILCVVYNTVGNRRQHSETGEERRIKEATARAGEMTKIEVKLDAIGADVRFMREDAATTKKEVGELRTEVALLKASISSAHKRMDSAGIGRNGTEIERKE